MPWYICSTEHTFCSSHVAKLNVVKRLFSYFIYLGKLWCKLLFLQTRGAEHSPWEPGACPSCPTATANRAGNISRAVLREYNFHHLLWFIATDDWFPLSYTRAFCDLSDVMVSFCLSVSGWKLSGGGQAAVLHRHVVSCVFAAGRSSCGNQLWTPVLWWERYTLAPLQQTGCKISYVFTFTCMRCDRFSWFSFWCLFPHRLLHSSLLEVWNMAGCY